MHKNSPDLVEIIDGFLLPSGPIIHWTTPFRVITLRAPHSLVILGMPWLTDHDPHIHC